MQEYDIVVIGAGPAGSTFARELENSFKVLLVDKRDFEKKKTCAGLLAKEAMEYLERRELSIDEEVLSVPQKVGLVYLDWDNERKKKGGELINIDRRRFDEWFYSLIDRNIETRLNTRYKGHQKKNDGLEVCLGWGANEETVKTSYLIGCDGSVSWVRRNSGIVPKKYRVAHQEETDIEVEDVYFIYDENINSFYSWLVPKDEFTIIGSAFSADEDLENFQYFKKRLEGEFGKFNSYSGESALMTRPRKGDISFGNERVILCGEASGLICPSSSEGMSYAFRSGDKAAKAFNKGGTNILNRYKESMSEIVEEILEKERRYNTIKDPEKRIRLF